MLDQPSLSEKVIMFLSKAGDVLDMPKSVNQLMHWDQNKYYKSKRRAKKEEQREFQRISRAFKRLERAELLSFAKNSKSYKLTPAGWLRYLYYASKQKPKKGKPASAGKYIIIFDIPEKFRRFRDLFRQCLVNRHCSLLQKSVFICPSKPVFTWAQKVVADCHLDGHVKFIEANKVY